MPVQQYSATFDQQRLASGTQTRASGWSGGQRMELRRSFERSACDPASSNSELVVQSRKVKSRRGPRSRTKPVLSSRTQQKGRESKSSKQQASHYRPGTAARKNEREETSREREQESIHGREGGTPILASTPTVLLSLMFLLMQGATLLLRSCHCARSDTTQEPQRVSFAVSRMATAWLFFMRQSR